MTEYKKNLIRKLWKGGATDAQIAEVMGMSERYIAETRRSMGLKCNSTRLMRSKREDLRPAIIADLKSGKYTCDEIRMRNRCGKDLVTQIRREEGIELLRERIAKQREQYVLEHYGQQSDAEMARVLHTTDPCVAAIRHKHGLKAVFGPKGKRL